MTSDELKRWLKKQGCSFDESRGKGGHILVIYGDKQTTLPMHGKKRDLGPGLVNAIKKQLGLK